MAKETLLPGLTNSKTIEVKSQFTTDHAAHPVLATPSMIALIEWVCMEATADHVDADEATVGIHVCVSHEASVMLGESIDIDVELRAVDGRKMTFDVEVRGPRGLVSQGTHQRAVVRLPAAS